MPICLSKKKEIIEKFHQMYQKNQEVNLSKFDDYITEYFYCENVLNQYVYEEFHSYHKNDFSAYLIHLIDFDKQLLSLFCDGIEDYYIIITDDNNGFVNGDFITLKNGLKTFEIYQKQYDKYEAEALEDERVKSFVAHGYYTVSNCFSYLIEISKDGDSARIKIDENNVTKWLEIEYIVSEDCNCYNNDSNYDKCDCESIPMIDKDGYNIDLNSVMRIN